MGRAVAEEDLVGHAAHCALDEDGLAGEAGVLKSPSTVTTVSRRDEICRCRQGVNPLTQPGRDAGRPCRPVPHPVVVDSYRPRAPRQPNIDVLGTRYPLRMRRGLGRSAMWRSSSLQRERRLVRARGSSVGGP